ncbi:hypothetical protein ES703_83631 [subsurface metagenome]
MDAEISLVEPYEGRFCCKLIGTGSKITQTLDYPCPVTGVWMFRFRARSEGTTALKPIALYTDGTSSEGGQTIFPDEWTDVFMLRQDMNAEKILSGIEIESVAGEIFIDDIFLGLATEIIAGAMEAGQGTPRNLQGEMIARPMGYEMEEYPKVGSVATSADEWRTVVGTAYTPPANYKFMLAKILVSCPSDVLYRLRWDGTVFSADEVFVTGGIPFTDWYPWGYMKMLGDGERTFDIQVRAPTADDEDTCYAEIVGEHVKWAFNV